MNLADAIRRAAQSSGALLGHNPSSRDEEESAVMPYQAFTVIPEPEQPIQAKEIEMKQEHEAHIAHEMPAGHNVVRLELVLNPEQLKGFFGAVMASQHSVLTLREAAAFLRVSQASLEHLAEDGEVPGMMVDGKWRFTRQALEDWLYSHPKKREA